MLLRRLQLILVVLSSLSAESAAARPESLLVSAESAAARPESPLRPRPVSLAPRSVRPLLIRGGGDDVVQGQIGREKNRTWLDRTISFLEAPRTEMTIGTIALALTIGEIAREVSRLGFYEANWALFALASARFLKALLSVLKDTKQALNGYRKYQIHELRHGRTVVLRQITAGSTQDVAEDPAAK